MGYDVGFDERREFSRQIAHDSGIGRHQLQIDGNRSKRSRQITAFETSELDRTNATKGLDQIGVLNRLVNAYHLVGPQMLLRVAADSKCGVANCFPVVVALRSIQN